MGQLLDSMLRASLLQTNVYHGMHDESGSVFQALWVVFLSGVAFGIGSGAAGLGGHISPAVLGIVLVAASLFAWLIWSFTAYYIGRVLFGPTIVFRKYLRSIGLAQSPGILFVLMAVPVIWPVVHAAVYLWILIAVIFAVRQVSSLSILAALMTVLPGWIMELFLRGTLNGVAEL